MTDLSSAVATILERRKQVPPERSLLVGISGIDGSGKGYVTSQLEPLLTAQGLRVAAIGIDGWLNLPPVRFDPKRLAENFYERGIRLDEMYRDLALPLKQTRNCHLVMDYTEETAKDYRKHTYDFEDIDVI